MREILLNEIMQMKFTFAVKLATVLILDFDC